MPDGSSSTADASFSGATTPISISLRILATTDLHMHLGSEARRGGLARLAPLIAAQRRAHANLLLFDNGDLLDGTPLADELARAGLGPHDVHPAIAALNRLGYDAATLGNHDFTHGVDFLRRTLGDARYPLVVANAGLLQGAPLWAETALLRRRMIATNGQPQDIAIGVFGVLPPQTVEWEAGLAQELTTEDIVTASRRAVSGLRARGADVIVALSHGGPGDGQQHRAENAADAIAGIAGVNAVIAGHTHEVMARPGTAQAAPLVTAGYAGTHLAAITLSLSGHPGTWQINATAAEAMAAPTDRDTPELIPPPPQASTRHLHAPIGRLRVPLSSHFALLGTDSGLRLTEAALRHHVATQLPDSPLPVLVALAPFRTGGRGGPEYFVDIPAGTFRRSDLSTLYPFTNHAAVIEVTGTDLSEWLERAASAFSHLPSPGAPAPLLDDTIPGFNLDMIAGLDYEIDLCRPAAFDGNGRRRAATGRVGPILYRGRPVQPDQRFLLVTNSYRMTGGPLYADLTRSRPCQLPPPARIRIRDIIARFIASGGTADTYGQPFFRLRAAPGTEAWFDTAPEADPAACPIPVRGRHIAKDGFQRLFLAL